MKKTLCLLLIFTMAFSLMGIPGLADETAQDYKPLIYGDVDEDGVIDSVDALTILKFNVGLETLTERQKQAAEVDAQEGINAVDAMEILNYGVGKTYYFPIYATLRETSFAYEEDPTADTSFKITREGLAPKTIYMISATAFAPVSNDSFLKSQAARFIVALQGLVNRDFDGVNNTSMIYITGDTYDSLWLKYMEGEGKFLNGYERVTIRTFDEFMTTFANQIKQCGIVEWDGNVPATANVASTICGLDGYLPVLKEDAEGSFYQMIVNDYNVPVKQSLVGLFTGEKGTKIADTDLNSSGSAKNDAYRWALEKYMDRCSSRYLAYTVDGAGCVKGNPTASLGGNGDMNLNCIVNQDYYIARRCFFFDLTCVADEAPCDDPDQPLGTDLETTKMIFQARYDRASGTFGQILGFPPWWLKYTSEFNNGQYVATTVEWMYVDLATSYNLAKEADAAQPCQMLNASAYYKYTPTTTEYKNNRPATKEKFDENTYYFLYYVGDYDSSAWLKRWVGQYWERDKMRGEIPLMWCFNPNLSNRVPMIFDYVYENKTANDYITAGDSGAGYVMPAALFKEGSNHRTMPDGARNWAAYCSKFYQKFDMDITGFIINGNYPMDERVMNLFNNISARGSFHNDPRHRLTIYKGTPYVYLHNGVDARPAYVEESVKSMYSYMNDMLDYGNFGAYRNVCHSPTELYNLQARFIEYASEKNSNMKYKFVDPYTYFDLIEQSGQGVFID